MVKLFLTNYEKYKTIEKKIENWEKEFDENFESEIKGLGGIWESHKIKSFIRQLLIQEKTKNCQKFIEILEELNEFVETESGKSGRKEILQKIQEVIKQLKDEK